MSTYTISKLDQCLAAVSNTGLLGLVVPVDSERIEYFYFEGQTAPRHTTFSNALMFTDSAGLFNITGDNNNAFIKKDGNTITFPSKSTSKDKLSVLYKLEGVEDIVFVHNSTVYKQVNRNTLHYLTKPGSFVTMPPLPYLGDATNYMSLVDNTAVYVHYPSSIFVPTRQSFPWKFDKMGYIMMNKNSDKLTATFGSESITVKSDGGSFTINECVIGNQFASSNSKVSCVDFTLDPSGQRIMFKNQLLFSKGGEGIFVSPTDWQYADGKFTSTSFQNLTITRSLSFSSLTLIFFAIGAAVIAIIISVVAYMLIKKKKKSHV